MDYLLLKFFLIKYFQFLHQNEQYFNQIISELHYRYHIPIFLNVLNQVYKDYIMVYNVSFFIYKKLLIIINI